MPYPIYKVKVTDYYIGAGIHPAPFVELLFARLDAAC